MKMSQDGLQKIVVLLKNVLNGDRSSSSMGISNSQYSVMYLSIFLEETEKNNCDVIGYDDFSGELWRRLGTDANDPPKKLIEFMDIWEAWVDLYRYLKKNGRLKQSD